MNTPNGERLHIGFFGKRNAGKSSLINRVTGQSLSVVSEVKGTTTDPVQKQMELLPLGPVTVIDTPGFDDSGDLGDLRVQKTKKVLYKTDIAILVVDATVGKSAEDEAFLELLQQKEIPYLTVYNKCELKPDLQLSENELAVSAKENTGIFELKEKIGTLKPETKEKRIISDKLERGSVAVLVCPIDESAPKGRLILPQQQTIRDLLDGGCIPVVCKETELSETLEKLKNPPEIVICDSQVFAFCANTVGADVPLTSFSVLMARYKGVLDYAVEGADRIFDLKENAKILISEGCTHHRQCGDIGTVKLPNLIRKKTGKDFEFSFTSGGEFTENAEAFDLIVHCGGCMLNDREMASRMARAKEKGVAMTNYGVLIAHLNGILKRSLEIFPEYNKYLN